LNQLKCRSSHKVQKRTYNKHESDVRVHIEKALMEFNQNRRWFQKIDATQAELISKTEDLSLEDLYHEATDIPGDDPFGRHWLPLPVLRQILDDEHGIAHKVVDHIKINGLLMYTNSINLVDAIRDYLFIRTTIIFSQKSIHESDLFKTIRSSFEESDYPKTTKHSENIILNFT